MTSRMLAEETGLQDPSMWPPEHEGGGTLKKVDCRSHLPRPGGQVTTRMLGDTLKKGEGGDFKGGGGREKEELISDSPEALELPVCWA